jgi:hypothetical protein
MKRRILIFVLGAVTVSQAGLGNPIPWPLPASMPLEEMSIEINREGQGLVADFHGDFTFNHIPESVSQMLFPVPQGSSSVSAWQSGTPLSWRWSNSTYPTVLPEMTSLPMMEWDGPFPEEGAVFTVAYTHGLIEREDEFVFFYALGTGKYFPTYDKVTTAEFDILLPQSFEVKGVWLDNTVVDPNEYEISDLSGRPNLHLTLTSQFGPFTKDLIVSLVPEPATLSPLALGGVAMFRRRRKSARSPHPGALGTGSIRPSPWPTTGCGAGT